MLVISRKWNESMVIDESLTVTVEAILGGKAILHITGPAKRGISFHRHGKFITPDSELEHDLMVVVEPQRRVWFDREIQLKLISLKNDKARIGLEAPKHIKFHRSEVDRRIRERGEQSQPVRRIR